jgi:hypothetical protein
MEILRQHRTDDAELSDREVTCDACGEPNPGNFEVCWNCGASIPRPG